MLFYIRLKTYKRMHLSYINTLYGNIQYFYLQQRKNTNYGSEKLEINKINISATSHRFYYRKGNVLLIRHA